MKRVLSIGNRIFLYTTE